MDLERTLRERGPRWTELARALDRAESVPERELGGARLRELLQLYRQTCSDLNEARSYTANPELLGRLNDLAGRGYRFLYRRPRGHGLGLRALLSREVPGAFRRRGSYVAAAAAPMLLGALVGLGAVLADPGHGERLIPGQFFTESPRERVERIESGAERIDTLDKALYFGATLFTHNIQVAFLSFSLGAATIAGGLWLLFYNGVILGAVGGMYLLDGVGGFFLGWVGPHGALELPAIVFSGAAGLLVGRALLLPGERSTGAALREVFADVWRIMIATALILVVAGLIEGSFSQFSSRSFPLGMKIGLAAALFSLLIAFLFGGRARREDR